MNKQTRVRLLGCFVVLGVLAGILGLPATPIASADRCCSYCDNLYNQCFTGTLYPQCNHNSSCCYVTLDPCYNTCDDGC